MKGIPFLYDTVQYIIFTIRSWRTKRERKRERWDHSLTFLMLHMNDVSHAWLTSFTYNNYKECRTWGRSLGRSLRKPMTVYTTQGHANSLLVKNPVSVCDGRVDIEGLSFFVLTTVSATNEKGREGWIQ